MLVVIPVALVCLVVELVCCSVSVDVLTSEDEVLKPNETNVDDVFVEESPRVLSNQNHYASDMENTGLTWLWYSRSMRL
jgi:hypothetical protein